MPIQEIEKFTILHMQILDEKGKVDPELEPDLTDEELTGLYRQMTLSRMADTRMLNLQRQGRLGTLPACTGQEAAFCAPVLALKETDWFVGSYREIGARLMRGESLVNLLRLYNGFEEGAINTQNARTLPISIILASQLPHAVGLAYGSRLQGEKDTVALTIFGDGATSEGDFHEALNFASVWKAPVIFLCQNNQFAISTPTRFQTGSPTIAQKAAAYGIPGIRVDGNDALAVYRAVKEAADRARDNQGPTLIEAFTFRMLMHTTADDPKRYRDDEMVESWKEKDPLTRFRIYLTRKKLWDDDRQKAMEDELKQEIDDSVKEFESQKDFRPEAPFDYVFENRDPDLEEQHQAFLEDMKKEAENG
ncbi:pyruvate dehydrogenase (acetyl-transferring) E1 component subunit alpha [Desulfospira joergensenii]|uniref:pyruvate dehydrogenase (acetyl-transferring) E1 component subunit alpha n=1 Tax=Desulfospira joergensenii TaxID=53329 RepID=UPI0003B376A6|nr:pyruvate dehydrogenase (acetyl-transferring) E1 component subunit alpha [Desulfospira joergensenii]